MTFFKRCLRAGLLHGLAVGVVFAQTDAPPSLADLRAQLEQTRAQAQARYAEEEATCYQRFAVNDCQREVRVRRRATMEDLRRQEIGLNDIERKNRAADQLRKADEKQAQRSGAQAQDQRDQALQAQQNREARAAEKKVQTLSEQAARQSEAKKAAYEEKLREAQARRAERDKARRENKTPAAPSLPIPPVPAP